MHDDPERLPLELHVLVVEIPDEPITLHLVCEVSRRGHGTPERPELRAPATVCGLAGYEATRRSGNACEECLRALDGAMRAARRLFLNRLHVGDVLRATNGSGVYRV